MGKLINKIKTMWWFWKLTDGIIDDKWVIETNTTPNKLHTMSIWGQKGTYFGKGLYDSNEWIDNEMDKVHEAITLENEEQR